MMLSLLFCLPTQLNGKYILSISKTVSSPMRRPETRKKLCSIPLDILGWLEAEAAATLATTNSVIVATCRRAMNAKRAAEQREARILRAARMQQRQEATAG
jgi:hypothetical protein